MMTSFKGTIRLMEMRTRTHDMRCHKLFNATAVACTPSVTPG